MKPIAGVKTIADALATVDAIEVPAQVALPTAPKDDAKESEKAAYQHSLNHAKAKNEFNAREASMISGLKEFAKARINAVPEEIKVIGLDIRASIADGMEVISLRIVHHK